MEQTAALLLAALAGLTSHWVFYNTGEHHLIARTIFKTYCFLFCIILFAQAKLLDQSLRDALIATASIAGVYAATIFTSMTIYRVFFHRLKKFPGPRMAMVSKFYQAWKTRDFQACIWMDKCHQQYGDFVRTGPTEITIYTPEAINPILGPRSTCGKSMWWEMMAPLESMVTTRSRKMHSSRRKAWDNGFSISALRIQEPTINHYVDELVSLISSQGEKPINLTDFVRFFAFDIMGDVNFGIKFNMTKDGKPNPWLATFQDGNSLFGIFTAVPWLFHITTMIPGMMNNWLRFKAWSDNLLRKRLQEKEKDDDMIYHVINHAQKEDGGIEARYHWLFGDFITMVLAASEPPMSTIIFLMYHLAKEPRHVAKLREELTTITDLRDNMQLQKLTHLNALIDETLRLYPSVPSGGLRLTPREGIAIGSTYIPGDVTVLIPQYTLHRREDCFEKPLEFIPERWSTRPELVKNHDAYIPFSVGNHRCLGENLAKIEVRLLVTRLVSRFDFAFAPGETGRDVTAKMMDLFTTSPGPLKMIFKDRDVFA